MRKLYRVVLLFVLGVTVIRTQAQVTVAGSSGANGSYTTLSAAFSAIAGNSQAGNNINISISGNTTEPGSVIMTPSAGAWTTLTIAPVGGPWTVSGAVVAGFPLLDFNAVSNVTINGGNNLIFENTTVSAAAGTSTIRFTNNSSNNNINGCTIKGASTMTGNTGGGTIFFGNSVAGNNSNTISGCTIAASGANLPSKAVFSANTTGTSTGNTISNCNIENYFNATAASQGVYIEAGNSAWIITGNRFYQTAPRDYTNTVTAYHSAILIQSTTGSNYTISNNIIGYANSAGTGTYTITNNAGAAFPKFSGIDIQTSNGTMSNITGNLINNISLTTNAVASASTTANAVFLGIALRAGNVTIGGTSAPLGNTIGDVSNTGAISVSVAANAGTSTDIVGIGIYNATVATLARYNNIHSISALNTSTSNARIVGISVANTASTPVTLSNNTIGGTSLVAGALINNSSGTGSYIHGIDVTNNQTGLTADNNIIRYFNNSAANTGLLSATASLTGIMLNSTLGTTAHYFSQNQIYGLYSTSGGSSNIGIIGIFMNAAATSSVTVQNNYIHSFSFNTSAAGAIMYGTIATTTFPANYTNNIIRLGIDAAGNSITVPGSIYGIYENGNNASTLFYNSVYIGGTGVSASTGLTACYYSNKTGAAAIVAYNIFANQRSSGGSNLSPHVIYRYNTFSGWTNNYNLHYLPNTAGTATAGSAWGYSSAGVSTTVFSTWQTTSSQPNSIAGDPGFVNASGSAAALDMHLSCPSAADQIQIGAPTIGTPPLTDYAGLTRSSYTPTDAGAYVVSCNLSISYTPLSTPLCGTGNQTFTANITTSGGTVLPADGSGNEPRVYYRKNGGAWVSTDGNFISGTQWSFTIDVSLVGGALSSGDVIDYFVVAQDNANSILVSNPGGASSATFSVNSLSAYPSSPNSYTVKPQLNGTYTVGVAGNYSTLTAAAAAYNNGCLTGPVVFSLTDANYPSETYPITFTSNSTASATNTLTIKPTGTTTISGSSATSILAFNGADYITINGSNSATVNSVCPLVQASRNLTIQNTNASTTSAVIWIYNNGADGATNLAIRNTNITGSAVTATLAGIGSGGSGIAPSSLGNGNNNNTFENNAITQVQYGLLMNGTNASRNTGTLVKLNSITTVGLTGIMMVNESAPIIEANTITNVYGIGSLSAVAGINLGAAALNINTYNSTFDVINALVSKNKIDNVAQTGNSSVGIAVNAVSGGTTKIYNNMISRVASNSTTATHLGAGIQVGGGGSTEIYHNTVYISNPTPYSVTSSAANNFALAIGGSTPATVDVKNNILVTSLSNATGKTVCIGVNTATSSLTSDYNDLNYTGTNSFTGCTGGLNAATTQLTLGNWNGVTGSPDMNSKNFTPVFISASDLHLNTANAGNTANLNAAGTTLAAVTDDIDCAPRPASPDLGCDEYDPTDLTAPVITITGSPVSGCASTFSIAANRTVTATITDFSGVPTSGGLMPRLYYRKNAGAWSLANSVAGTLSSGSGTNGTWSFVIPGAFLADNDVIDYFVIAQDIVATPNIAFNPAAGSPAATDVNTVTTAPTISTTTFTVYPTLNGTYTVGTSGNYTSLGAMATAYNTGCITGNVIFRLQDASYTPGSPVQFNENASANAGPFSCTIQPATGVSAIINGNFATATIIINGADNIIINGSNNPVVNSTCYGATNSTRNLTITNTNSSVNSAVVWLQTASSGATPAVTGSAVKNCIITGNASTTTLFGIGMGSAAGGIAQNSFGNGNNNNTFENNAISKVQYGIYTQGNSTTKNSGNTINLNQMTTGFPNGIGYGGIFAGYENTITISANSIGGIASSSSSFDAYAINLGLIGFNATTLTGAEVTNATVTRNVITQVQSNSAAAASAAGIVVASAATGTNIIANNMISGIISSSTGSDLTAGILVGGGTGTTQIYYNTVYLTGGRGSASQNSYALAIGGSNPIVDNRNNILVNTQTAVGGGASYALGLSYNASYSNLTSNNNDMYTGLANVVRVGGLTTAGGTNYPTVTGAGSWNLASGKDANSISVLPVFLSATDLHLDVNNATNSQLNAAGAPLIVTTDIDCDTRDVATPDMGCDEFTPPQCTIGTGGTISPASVTGCGSVSQTLTLSGAIFGNAVTYQWQSSPDNSTWTNIPGATTVTYNATATSTTYYRVVVTCSIGPITYYSASALITVNTAPNITFNPANPYVCGAGNSVTITASGATTYSWSPATGLNTTTGATVTATLSSAQTYTVTGTLGSCNGTATVTVGIAPAVSISGPSASQTNVCLNGSTNLTSAASSSYTVSSIAYAPESVCGSVTTIDRNTSGWVQGGFFTAFDEGYFPTTLPFDFVFYANTYTTGTELRLGSNGFVTFGTTGYLGGSAFSVGTIPSSAIPNNTIYGIWRDLDFSNAGSIRTWVCGSAPNRRYVIEYNAVPNYAAGAPYNNSNTHTFQIVLYETTNCIDVIVTNSPSATKTIGIENATGSAASFPAGRNAASFTVTNPPGEAWRFCPGNISFSWSPSTFLNSTTIANPKATNMTSTQTYTVTATELSTGCSASGSITITVGQPLSVSATVNPGATVCAGGATVSLNATPSGGGGPYTYTWSDGFSTIGTTQNVNSTPSATTTYTVTVSDACGQNANASQTVTVSNPAVLSVTNGQRCGAGPVTMTATPAGGSNITWYSLPSGGATLATGNSYSPVLGVGTYTYYVAAGLSGISTNVAPPDPATLGTFSTIALSTGTIFTTSQAFLLNSVTIYPGSSGQSSTIRIIDQSTGLDVPGSPVSYVTTVSGGNTPQVIPMGGISIQPGITYVIQQGPSLLSLSRNDNANAPWLYPFTTGPVTFVNNTTNLNRYYYYFYNWDITLSCESARVPVTATVSNLPSITASATAPTICSGASTTLNVSSSNTNYTYTWNPGAFTGSSYSVTPASNTTYTVTALDNVGASPYFGCSTSQNVSITVNPRTGNPSVTPASGSICVGATLPLTASGSTGNYYQFGTQAAQNNTSGTTAYPAPYTVLYGGQKMQFLILASELSAAGFVAGSDLTSIQFPVASLGSDWGVGISQIPSFRVGIGTTSLTTLTTFQTLTNYTVPASFTPTVGYTNSHTFATPLTWNGTDNIIIETTFSTGSNGLSSRAVFQYNSPAGYTCCIVYRADNQTAPAMASYSGTPTYTYTSRPDFRLNGTTIPQFTWSPTAGLFTNAAGTVAYSGTPATTLYANPSAVSSTYTINANNIYNCPALSTTSATVNMNVNITASTNLIAPVNGGARIGYQRNNLAVTNHLFDTANCNLVATVVPGGANPISGIVSGYAKKEVVDIAGGTSPLFNGYPYVERHFDIWPVTNVSDMDTRTGTITLYVLQSEFDNYNNFISTWYTLFPLLPTGPSDLAAIANIRVTHWFGQSATGAPGTYSGWPTMYELITPTVTWDPPFSLGGTGGATGWWKITFPAVGFGGYFIHTDIGGVLPVNWLNITAYHTNGINKVEWKVTEDNMDRYEVERSADGRSFEKIGTVRSNGARNVSITYTLDDVNPLRGVNYYRIKSFSKDGRSNYSRMVMVMVDARGMVVGNLYPNPATTQITYEVVSGSNTKATVELLDITGKQLKLRTESFIRGTNTLKYDIENLPQGQYMLRVTTADGYKDIKPFVKL
jgi:hypothetical protein